MSFVLYSMFLVYKKKIKKEKEKKRCLLEILSWLLDDKGGGRLVSCI